MIPTWLVQLCTVVSVVLGAAIGWFVRGWRDRVRVLEELKKRGIDPENIR